MSYSTQELFPESLSQRPLKYWIAVASAEHVHRGQAGGFMQVCHGKGGPLRRMRPGDRVVYYAPTEQFQGTDKLRSFVAIGTVEEREPYQTDMGGCFQPFRRDVAWLDSRPAPIAPLLQHLDFSANNRNWGYQLRFGLFEISEHDMQAIAVAMHAAFEEAVAA